MRDRLNMRFLTGHPSANLCEAGVLVHTFDDHLDSNAPWRVRSDGWMQQYSHVLSTSMVNARKHGVFNGNGGVVLSAASRVLCSYPYDGGAMNFEDGCGPELCSDDNVWNCAFPPDMLDRMMQIHESGGQWPYNEVVVDSSDMIVEAVFGGAGLANMHAAYLRHYGVDASRLPLLDFMPWHPTRPFACVKCEGGY